ncbi:MAG: zinc-dependent dehydrogenase [Pseudomonadota bacterium]
MRVAMYYNNKDIRIQEMPVPVIGPEELLVKIWASGICGSDLLEWYRLPKAPLVLGHEIAGEIVQVGERVKGWKTGTRVFVSHHVPCNMCRFCLADHHSACNTLKTTNFDPGGFCEYVRVPAINVLNGVFELPESMSYEEGVFIEPLACVFRGQHNVGWKPGRVVLVIGAGIAGLMHVGLAAVTGASRIFAVDVNSHRLEAALRFGADETIPADEDVKGRIAEANSGRLADLVIVCAGAPSAIKQAFESVEPGGSILFFAPADPDARVEMPFNHLWRHEITMTSSYAGSPRDIVTAMDLIAGGRIKVKDMITHRLPLSETLEGFGLVAQGGKSIKVVVEPQR